MNFFKGFFSRSGEAKELIEFFWKERMWFLIPIIIIILLFGFVLMFAQATGIAPFIYTLF